ncbi:hypothetical protein DB347_23700 [Opitutaceae bacterium EW11]|nr:hypothetical protein DB347_23700 [Opitutaceae bacterium EW11]
MGLDGTVFSDATNEDLLATERLGNSASIAYLRDFVMAHTPDAEIILEKVLHSGTHTGDEIPVSSLERLRGEVESVSRSAQGDASVAEFVARCRNLVDTAIRHRRPITF